MAGFHSLLADLDTAAALENAFPSCVAAKIWARPLRQPCQATQTRPLESVAAAGSMSDPASLERRTAAPGFPFSTGRAHTSQFPLSFADQITQGRPLPSTATAGRYKSPPGSVMAMVSPQAPPEYLRNRSWSPPAGAFIDEKSV